MGPENGSSSREDGYDLCLDGGREVCRDGDLDGAGVGSLTELPPPAGEYSVWARDDTGAVSKKEGLNKDAKLVLQRTRNRCSG